MSLDTIHADDIEDGITRWAANPGPDPGTSFRTVGFLGAGLKALPAAAFDVGGAAADAISGFTPSLLATGGGEGFSQPGQQDQAPGLYFDTAGGNALRRRADEFSPDPLTAHAADQVLHGLVRFGAKAGLAVGTMGPAGALLLGAEETENETQRLRAQGVDTSTAVKVGAVQGVASAAGAVMPLGGKTILQTLGLVAAGGPGMFMGQEALSKKILQSAGQNDQASLHNPFDPLGLAVSTVIPGAFGALHVRSVQRTALERVVEHIESGGQRYGKDGELLTSPKGAQGEMQVMPGTATDPGFGVTPAQNNSPEELARVGRDYLGAMATRYGDSDKALAAYNAGPGAVDKAIAAHGDDWLKNLPRETQEYVHKANALGARHAGEVAAQDPANVDAARVATTNDALTRSLPDTPDAVAQVHRAADIVAEDGGRAAEQVIAPVIRPEAQVVQSALRDVAAKLDLGMYEPLLWGEGLGKPEGANIALLDNGDLPRYFKGERSIQLPKATPEDYATLFHSTREDVLAHELGHALADKFEVTGSFAGPQYKALRDEMREISKEFRPGVWEKYKGHAGKDQEMLADSLATWLTRPDARAKMPELTALLGERLKPFEPLTERLRPSESNNAIPPHDSITLAGDEPAARGEELGSTQREASKQTADAGKPAPAAKDPEARARDLELLQKRRTTLQSLLDCLEAA